MKKEKTNSRGKIKRVIKNNKKGITIKMILYFRVRVNYHLFAKEKILRNY